MTEVLMKSLIRQVDKSTAYRQKSLDHNYFAKELLSVVPTCIEYQETDDLQLHEKTKECERLKECLKIAQDKVAKLCMLLEDRTKSNQIVLSNNHTKEFLDSVNFLKTRSESNEHTNFMLKSENDDLKRELETLKRDNLALNSNLKLAHRSLNEAKSQCERIESERENLDYLSEKLCTLLLKYQQQIRQIKETKETTTQTSCDDSNSNGNESDSVIAFSVDISTSEENLDENVNEFDDDEMLISPPSHFRDDSSLGRNINPNELLVSKKQKLLSAWCEETSSKTILKRKASKITAPDSPAQSNFKCDICGRVFLKKSSITLHVRSHLKTFQSFQCEKCGKLIRTENNKQKLEKCRTCNVDGNSHSNKTEQKTCDPLKGNTSGKLAKIDIKISSFCCIVCNKYYSCKSALNAHIRGVHNEEKPYECTECGKRFTQKSKLKRHTLVHGSQRPFKCSVCNVGFRDESDKRRHERIVHEGSNQLQCAHCDIRFNRKLRLITHIHTKHFSEFQKQFQCTICHKSFTTKYHLDRHKFMHEPQRSFKCSFCDCSFKYPDQKTTHETTIHGEGVRFHCQHCGKVYRHNSYLIRHLRKDHVE